MDKQIAGFDFFLMGFAGHKKNTHQDTKHTLLLSFFMPLSGYSLPVLSACCSLFWEPGRWVTLGQFNEGPRVWAWNKIPVQQSTLYLLAEFTIYI